MRYTLVDYSALDEFALILNHVSGPFPIAGDACRELPKRTTAEASAPVPNPHLRLRRAYCLSG